MSKRRLEKFVLKANFVIRLLKKISLKEKMDQKAIDRLVDIYNNYKELSWSNDFNFSFWKIMLDQSVKKLKEDTENGLLDRDFLSQGIYAVFDVPNKDEIGWLHTGREVKEITIDTVDSNQNSFLYEVINLSMIRHYNAVENMLLESINVCYGKVSQFDVYNRKCINALKKKLKIEYADNNMNLIAFLENNSQQIKDFLAQPFNIDVKETWKDLFLFFGIVRNSIVHNAMLFSWEKYLTFQDIENNIFHYFFEKPTKTKWFHLRPRLDRYGLFAHFSDQFTVAIIKRLADQKNLNFLNLVSANR